MAHKRRQELRDSSYINIQGWMARLTTKDGRALSLAEMIIFANIYGYSQDGKSRYSGGISYLMDFLHMTKPTVLKHLATLEESGLIGRYELEKGEVDYFVLTSVIDSIGQKNLPVKNFNRSKIFTDSGDSIGNKILPVEGSDLFYNKKNNKKNKAHTREDAAAAVSLFDEKELSVNVNEEKKEPPTPVTPAPRTGRKARTAAPAFDFRAALIDLGVTPDTADDWLLVRKATRAVNTATAFKDFVREVAKTGITAEACAQFATIKNWRGFTAEWYFNAIQESQAKAPAARPAVIPNRF